MIPALLIGLLTAAPASEPTPKAFAKAFIEMVNARDTTAQRALVHPASFEGLSPAEQAFVEVSLAKDFRYVIPPDHAVTVKKLESGPPPFDGFVTWPVTPVLSLQITFETSGPDGTTLVRFLGRADDGGWVMLAARPTPEVLQKWQDKVARDASQTAP